MTNKKIIFLILLIFLISSCGSNNVNIDVVETKTFEEIEFLKKEIEGIAQEKSFLERRNKEKNDFEKSLEQLKKQEQINFEKSLLDLQK